MDEYLCTYHIQDNVITRKIVFNEEVSSGIHPLPLLDADPILSLPPPTGPAPYTLSSLTPALPPQPYIVFCLSSHIKARPLLNKTYPRAHPM